MERETIERAATLAGLELAPDTDVTVTGCDPVLASPFHLGEGAATALALVGQEADRIWRLRGGQQQSVSVDVRHAAASLHSFALLRLEAGGDATPQRRVSPLTGIFECGDGRYIHLHSSFRDAPGVLGGAGAHERRGRRRRSPVRCDSAGPSSWRTRSRRSGCAGRCAGPRRSGSRIRRESCWHQRRWSRSSASVMERRCRSAKGARPLSGVRVLDLTRVLAGPTCARTLAEHGADVLHIASPGLPTLPLFEMDTGHGKRQAYADLDDAAQAETLRELVRGADVFSQGFRHGALERRGLGAEDLARLRPGIIYVSENAYGHAGPWRHRPGWEQLAQATTGVTVIQGIERPSITPAAMNDYTTGYFGALGVMMALRRRAEEGGSWRVTVSLSQTSMWYMRLEHELDRLAQRGGRRVRADGGVRHAVRPHAPAAAGAADVGDAAAVGVAFGAAGERGGDVGALTVRTASSRQTGGRTG